MTYNVLIVGTGISGIILAEKFASIGKKILIIDRRNHIGGNCYDKLDRGVLIHQYGSHRFRTNSEKVKKYLSNFTEWHPYKVHNKSFINGKYYTFPINIHTINEVFKTKFTKAEQVRVFLDFLREHKTELTINNSEDYVTSKIGTILYEMFYKYYTMKQWGIHPKELDKSVCGRVPVYYDNSDEYVEGKECIMPKEGYTKMFEKMLNHPNITVKLNVNSWDMDLGKGLIIWTGKIDEFFNYKFGKLPYRSLRFEFKEYEEQYHQQCYKIAYPCIKDDSTKDIEIKYLTGQKCSNTIIMREFPMSSGEPFYPIPTYENKELYLKYKKESDKLKNVIFIGRNAEYLYKDMDKCVLDCLNKFEELRKNVAV